MCENSPYLPLLSPKPRDILCIRGKDTGLPEVLHYTTANYFVFVVHLVFTAYQIDFNRAVFGSPLLEPASTFL